MPASGTTVPSSDVAAGLNAWQLRHHQHPLCCSPDDDHRALTAQPAGPQLVVLQCPDCPRTHWIVPGLELWTRGAEGALPYPCRECAQNQPAARPGE